MKTQKAEFNRGSGRLVRQQVAPARTSFRGRVSGIDRDCLIHPARTRVGGRVRHSDEGALQGRRFGQNQVMAFDCDRFAGAGSCDGAALPMPTSGPFAQWAGRPRALPDLGTGTERIGENDARHVRRRGGVHVASLPTTACRALAAQSCRRRLQGAGRELSR